MIPFAITMAKKDASLTDEDDILIREYPSQKLFNLGMFVPNLFGVDITKTPAELKALEFMFKNDGVPMTIIGLDMIDILKEIK